VLSAGFDKKNVALANPVFFAAGVVNPLSAENYHQLMEIVFVQFEPGLGIHPQNSDRQTISTKL
jgi:hypothetical protein